jgi:hypothetical protein
MREVDTCCDEHTADLCDTTTATRRARRTMHPETEETIMDPDTELAELRRCVKRCLETGYGDTVTDEWRDDALEALERVAALDEFITRGGYAPAAWAAAT